MDDTTMVRLNMTEHPVGTRVLMDKGPGQHCPWASTIKEWSPSGLRARIGGTWYDRPVALEVLPPEPVDA